LNLQGYKRMQVDAIESPNEHPSEMWWLRIGRMGCTRANGCSSAGPCTLEQACGIHTGATCYWLHTIRKMLGFCVPQFPHLWNRDMVIISNSQNCWGCWLRKDSWQSM
jgi:hypothetical protein